MSQKLRGKESEAATTSVKRLALLLLEITLPNISTSLIQVFVCTRFDHGAFLRESLTLSCDASGQRIRWVVFAAVALAVYIAGVPLLLFTTLFQHRRAIEQLGAELQRHNIKRGGTGLNANQLVRSKQARSSFTNLTSELRWLMPKFEKFVSLPPRAVLFVAQ